MEVTKTSAKSVTFKTNHFSVYAIGVYDASKHSDADFLKTSKDVEAANAAADENTAEPTTEDAKPAESEAGYTYTDLSATMFAQQTVNVRDLPDTSGNKIGSLKTNDEVTVTGQCNETGWYRISYGGGTAYVSNSYVSSEKVAVSQPKNDAANSSAGNNSGSTSANSSESAPASSGASTTTEAVAAARAMGYDLDTLFTAEDGHQYGYYIESNWPSEPGYMHEEWLVGHGTTTTICMLGDYFQLRRIDIYAN
jgi:uncharacterized protein YgiM (DUF1202 family)